MRANKETKTGFPCDCQEGGSQDQMANQIFGHEDTFEAPFTAIRCEGQH